MWTGKALEQHIRTGIPVVYNKKKIVPFTRVFRLTLPLLGPCLVWNRPSGVLVVDENGEEILLPVRDETRNIQLLLLAGGILTAGLMWLIFIRRCLRS